MDFREVEDGAAVGKDEYAARLEPLRVDLLNAQFDLRARGFAVLLLVMGDDRAACEAVTDRLHEWLDPRGLDTEAFIRKREEEKQRPLFWRYWRALPAHGRIGVFLGGWALHALEERLAGKGGKKRFARRCGHAAVFERGLAADGTLLVKLWLHAPQATLERRLAGADDEEHGWRARAVDRAILEQHPKIVRYGEQLVAATDAPWAPWFVVESSDPRTRDLAVFEHLLERLRAGLEERAARPPTEPLAPLSATDPAASERAARDDRGADADADDYESELHSLQRRLSDRAREARERGIATVLAFEGMDAAGKGGAIRRLVRGLSAALYRVVPVSAPTDEERAHHWLWRFWRRLPRAGEMTIFDRSWYGRVLVERVEGFATEGEWRRAYGEIRDFEAQLVEHGTVVAKFWLQIDLDEQLRRFEARARTPYKKYKLTDDDYRNRGRWPEYERAVDEMVARTHTDGAPWHRVAANDKRHARLEVLRTVVAALEARL